MAAHGVLVYAMKNHGADVVRNSFIFWWCYDLYVVKRKEQSHQEIFSIAFESIILIHEYNCSVPFLVNLFQ